MIVVTMVCFANNLQFVEYIQNVQLIGQLRRIKLILDILLIIMSGIVFRGDQIFFESDLENQSKQQGNEYQNDNTPHLEQHKRPRQKTDKQSKPENSQFRSSQKNKFINKIKDIDPELSLRSLQKGANGSQSEQKSFLDKRERNKYSAKQSRDRKKLYIEIMQQKQKKLQQQLANKKRQLQETKNYLQKVVSQNQTMSSFTTGRFQMIKKLEILLDRKNEEGVQEEINMIIDSLRYRIGATGRERINTINEYFRQIVNLSLPALHRYMMWSASQSCHMFGSEQNSDQWYQQIKESLNLSEEQLKQIVQNQPKFIQQKKTLENLIKTLRDIKNNIQVKSIQLEQMIDNIRDILTPVQCAKFILFIQKNKYRKELNLCDVNEQQKIRKLVKKEDI